MHAWETRLNARDNNRVVRPLDWGVEWTQGWPCRNGCSQDDAEQLLSDLNRRILSRSDEFFSYRTPTDFRLEQERPSAVNRRPSTFLRFSSPVSTPYAENNTVHARWFPAKGDRAVVVLPQWNADAESHNALCRIFSWLGVAALRLSLP